MYSLPSVLPIEKLNRILDALLGSNDVINRWWVSPNKAFNDNTPFDTYQDHPEQVTKYLFDQIGTPYS